MSVDPELLALLVCASCKGALIADEEAAVLTCSQCGLRFPVREGYPIMLVEEATPSTPQPPDASGRGS